VKRFGKCSVGGSFGAVETPPFPISLYLSGEAGLGSAQLLDLRSFAGRPGSETFSAGEFGWGGTSVKP
jgi:hypothetical protein